MTLNGAFFGSKISSHSLFWVILEVTVRVTIDSISVESWPKITTQVVVWLTLTRRLRNPIWFLGGEAIRASEEIGLENDLPDDFVQQKVPSMYQAIQKLADFVKDYSK